MWRVGVCMMSTYVREERGDGECAGTETLSLRHTYLNTSVSRTLHKLPVGPLVYCDKPGQTDQVWCLSPV